MLDGLNVRNSYAVKKMCVVECATVNVGQRQEGDGDVILRLEFHVGAGVRDIRTKVRVRQHDAFGLARRAGGVDDRGELAGQDLRDAHSVGCDVSAASGSNQSLIT